MDGWWVGKQERAQRGTVMPLDFRQGKWAPRLVGMGPPSGSQDCSLLIPVSLWHQQHLITTSPRIKI